MSQVLKDIVYDLHVHSKCSASEVSNHLGRSVSSVRYHLQKLVSLGLVKEVSKGYSFGGAFAGYDYSLTQR